MGEAPGASASPPATVHYPNRGPVVLLPSWLKYAPLVAFACVVAMAAAGYDLTSCCFIAVIGLGLLRRFTVEQALAYIDLDVYLTVAFSFGIGTAMTKSGLAATVAAALVVANLSGFSELLVVAAFSTLMANLLSTKAAAQVVFPIVYELYTQQGKDPMGGVMVPAGCCCMCFSTPIAYVTNMMVMGAGGYTPKHFLIMGVPLNFIAGLCITASAYFFYVA